LLVRGATFNPNVGISAFELLNQRCRPPAYIQKVARVELDA
jgi:hypothetical protein